MRTVASLLLASLCATALCSAGQQTNYVERITPLIDPVKLATLGPRGANPRVQKYVYWLSEAQKSGTSPKAVVNDALEKVGLKSEAAKLTKTVMLRNLEIAQKLGCLDQAGMEEMKRGRSPTVRKGPYAGQELSVDHIIPRAVCPELDNAIANLELLPLRLNESKNSKIGNRQADLAKKLNKAGLLSDEGLRAVFGALKGQ